MISKIGGLGGLNPQAGRLQFTEKRTVSRATSAVPPGSSLYGKRVVNANLKKGISTTYRALGVFQGKMNVSISSERQRSGQPLVGIEK